MKKTILRVAVCLLSLLVAFSFPMVSSAEEDTVTLDLKNGSITISATGYKFGSGAETTWTQNYHICYTGAGATANTLTFTGVTCSVILDNVSMSKNATMVTLTSASDVTMILKGTNSVSILTKDDGNKYNGTAIRVSDDSRLTIDSVNGDDTLNVDGGTYGAGIGSYLDAQTTSAQIVINSGIINATTGNEGAAIGGARKSGAQITINGGVINATSVKNAAAIGAGRWTADPDPSTGSTITINGGVINAIALVNGAGIGGGFKSNATVVINGGVIFASNTNNGRFAIGRGVDATGEDDVEINGGSILTKTNSAIKALTAAVNSGDQALSLTTVTLPAASGFLYVDGAKQTQ